MKSIIIAFFLFLTSWVYGQDVGKKNLESPPTIVYPVAIPYQKTFVDSLFSELRVAGFREIIGIGESYKFRSVKYKSKEYQYGVIVFYNFTSIIIRFYTGNEIKRRDAVPIHSLMKEDFLAQVKLTKKPL